MPRTMIVIALAFATAGCSASFSAGKPSDKGSLDGKPAGSNSQGKSVADRTDDDDVDTRSASASDGDDDALAAKPGRSEAGEPDCIPGKAEGHTKDKAQGEAKGHDKPPCPEEPGNAEPAKDAGKSEAAKNKSSPKASSKGKGK